MYKKKLIEVALPLDAINAASAREKSIRHGHPSTLHLWWARRPLAAARAVIWASLVDDPSSNPEKFPTEEAQQKERDRLFGILEELVIWESSNNEKILNKAKAEILKSTDGNPPPLLDPFAGGGAIPLEAQRLGLKAYASDLNPVAVMINKAMIEIPPKFANQPPVNPEAREKLINEEWKAAAGLAEDVRYYAEWVKNEAFKRIGHLYPTAKDEQGHERTVIAWIWTRTVKCPNPACGCEMPLANNFWLSKKKGSEAYIQPNIQGKTISYEVRYGKDVPKPAKVSRNKFRCIVCETAVDIAYVKDQGMAKNLGVQLMAIVTEGDGGRLYLSPNEEHVSIAHCPPPEWKPEGELFGKAGDQLPLYGFSSFAELFTDRQLNVLTTLVDLVGDVKDKIKAQKVFIERDSVPFDNETRGAKAYAEAIAIYLAFIIDKITDRCCSLSWWQTIGDKVAPAFTRHALPMVWDYCESNPFSNSSGCFDNTMNWVIKVIERLPTGRMGRVEQWDAQLDNGLRDVMVSTDPPYYDNIAYADLSDWFYVWLRKTALDIYPGLFQTMLVPKMAELVATPYRFTGGKDEARDFFEEGMSAAFEKIYAYSREDVPLTVYYAYKQSDGDTENKTASTGWETMLSALIDAGFSITGTWPIRTERTGRVIGYQANALASSIILVCRKRKVSAPISTRRDFIGALKRELKPALDKLQNTNIAPVDMAQSAIGPGMAVFSRYSKVLEADGTPMRVRTALQLINRELDAYFSDQDGELDSDSRFCVDLFTQYAFNDIKFGDADVLARAKNTSVERLASSGVLSAEKGIVRLLTREEIPEKVNHETIWLLTQQLTRALEKDGIVGAAKIVADIHTSEPERARALAYRLYTIAERKNWAAEAYAYNSLVITWRDIQSKAAELQAKIKDAEQGKLFD